MMKTYLELIVFASSLILVFSYQKYFNEIPNSDRVKNPITGRHHHGVGHIAEGGSGARNCFGKDFQAAENKWTVKLCYKDSDGDGKTNGEELGDPGCAWKVGEPEPTPPDHKISHPGFCTPVNTTRCQQYNHPNSTCVYVPVAISAGNNARLVTLGCWACLVVAVKMIA